MKLNKFLPLLVLAHRKVTLGQIKLRVGVLRKLSESLQMSFLASLGWLELCLHWTDYLQVMFWSVCFLKHLKMTQDSGKMPFWSCRIAQWFKSEDGGVRPTGFIIQLCHLLAPWYWSYLWLCTPFSSHTKGRW